MPGRNIPIIEKPVADNCAPIACKDCGIFLLCRAVGGDVDLSLLDTIVKSRKTYKRGEFLYRVGEPFRAVYAIRCGSVKTSVLTNDGRTQVTGFHIAGELLGLSAIAANRYNNEARALETTSVCEVPFDHLEDISRVTPTLPYEMLRVMSNEVQENQELMLLLGKKNAEERLATYLLSLSRRFQSRNYSPTQFNLTMSRGDIGNYLGLAEETVCRILSRFQDEGLIDSQRRQIRLNDLERLKSIARG